MRHVDDEVCAASISNLAHARVIDGTAIGRSAGNDDLWTVKQSISFERVIVYNPSFEIDPVREGLKVC